ncbi:hypothetical protein CDL15_Pgr000801 [Punica granatum]|uniref:Cupin type-1 domain-containing protein n=1 Tax=Punica granatum TaxID=22663 RepID=A0A218W491_PUNGR|nr:hypothetical protein CDL15_Pgr000801 [Punica granatum]
MMKLVLIFSLLAFASSLCFASDPSPLQDICVAIKDPKSAVFVNGKFCRDPNLATAEDFFYSGLQKPGNTSNPLGSKVTTVNVDQIPGLNTLGISLARIDYAPYGLNPPHTHPRATEILVIVEGELYVGFVTSNQLGNKLFTKYPSSKVNRLTQSEAFCSNVEAVPFNFLRVTELFPAKVDIAR